MIRLPYLYGRNAYKKIFPNSNQDDYSVDYALYDAWVGQHGATITHNNSDWKGWWMLEFEDDADAVVFKLKCGV
jgi:hypothetical protein